MTSKKQLEKKLEKIKKNQARLGKERLELEREIATVSMKDKRMIISKHKAGKEGYTFDCDKMKITGEEIGTTGFNKEFRIYKFKDNTFGFFINTTSQGNFLLTRKEVEKICDYALGKNCIRVKA